MTHGVVDELSVGMGGAEQFGVVVDHVKAWGVFLLGT